MKLGYDALCVLSGDGLVHEVFNAYAARADSEEAFRLPVIQIPTGSANGFSISLLGLKVCRRNRHHYLCPMNIFSLGWAKRQRRHP